MTLALARKIKAAQPKLWNYAYTLRKQDTARSLLDPDAKQIALHVSPKYGNARYCLAPVLPIAKHPDMPNRVIVVDLGSNIDILLSSNPGELARVLFERIETDEPVAPEERLNINVIALNRAPMVAILKTLLPENINRLNIDSNVIECNSRKLLRAGDVAQKLRAVFGDRKREVKPLIAEEALYDGFISDRDQTECANFWKEMKNGKSWVNARFVDQRLRDLHARLKTKVAPQELTKTEEQEFHRFVRQQLVRSERNIFEAQQSITDLLQQELSPEETLVLRELQNHLLQTAVQYGVENTD